MDLIFQIWFLIWTRLSRGCHAVSGRVVQTRRGKEVVVGVSASVDPFFLPFIGTCLYLVFKQPVKLHRAGWRVRWQNVDSDHPLFVRSTSLLSQSVWQQPFTGEERADNLIGWEKPQRAGPKNLCNWLFSSTIHLQVLLFMNCLVHEESETSPTSRRRLAVPYFEC